jgi:DNA-damage-inducible protein J
MSEAISLYLTQITLNKGIPFEIKIPNKITAKTLQESENGKNLHKVSDIDELFEELDS